MLTLIRPILDAENLLQAFLPVQQTTIMHNLPLQIESHVPLSECEECVFADIYILQVYHRSGSSDQLESQAGHGKQNSRCTFYGVFGGSAFHPLAQFNRPRKRCLDDDWTHLALMQGLWGLPCPI